MDKICTKCGKTKELSNFGFVKTRNYYQSQCKECAVKIALEYRKNNKQKISQQRKKRDSIFKDKAVNITSKKCIECNLIKQANEFRFQNKSKRYLKTKCIDCENIYAKKYYKKNTDVVKSKAKQKRKTNKEKISKQRKITSKKSYNKIKNDPIYKLRKLISNTINRSLKKSNGSKNKSSIMDYLTYTIEELKAHIESQWEPWMNWCNRGPANATKHTWQIDHIIPQSALPYDSMDHPNFLKCWNLENLRPLEAIENVRKGNKIINIGDIYV